jgi:bacillithiol biosynthesis deacetylase BshB1
MVRQDGETVDVLVFGAHPDDLELACGGTVAHTVRQGRRVGLCDLTRGEMGTRGTPETRAGEAENARRILGAAFRESLDFGDGALRTGRAEELEIIRLIRRCRPAVVIAPYPDDRHPDHARAGTVVTAAAFYAGLQKIDTGQPPHRPQSVVYQLLAYTFEPSFVVDVTADWGTKMEAVKAYQSQFYNPDSNERETIISQKDFLGWIEGRARHFGSMIGAIYGEPFVTKQPPRIADIVAAYSGREVG